MKIFETESSLALANISNGQLVQTKGALTATDNRTKLWLIAETGNGVSLAGGNVAIPLTDLNAKAGRKNYLINGNLNTTIINQRGFGGGQPGANVYGFDRWKGSAGGTQIEQVVENTEVINETFTISWVGGTGIATVDGVGGLSSGDSFILNTSTNFSVVVPTDASYIQLEKGPISTAFEVRPISEELALAQRYYYEDIGQIYTVHNYSDGAADVFVWFPVTMRIDPTITADRNSYTSGGETITENSFRDLSVGAQTGSTRSLQNFTADAEFY